jgi:hypothetical protein
MKNYSRSPHDWGCQIHHCVLFSKEELKKHLESGCHLENIQILPGKDPLGRIPFNWVARSIDAMNISEEEKKQNRAAHFW